MRYLSLLLFLLPCLLSGQILEEEGVFGEDWGGYFWGARGGLSLGNQDWSTIETELNLGFHGDLFLESIPANSTFSFWGSLGFHQRGSRISRRRAITFQGNGITLPADNFVFNNVVASLGGKQVFGNWGIGDAYYLIGLRAEYNVSTNLGEYDLLSNTQGISYRSAYPIDSYEFINRFTYGFSAGAGVVAPLSESLGGFVEITAHPDLSFQYNQGPIDNVIDPFGSGNTTIGERAIRNFTIEVSVGLRLLRKWRYVD